MSDKAYVEATVTYLVEHVPFMWHDFAAWMLREVCKDQPYVCLAIADLHDRWQEVTNKEWSELAESQAELRSTVIASWSTSSARAVMAAAEFTLEAELGEAASAALSAKAAAGSEESAWCKMADWLRSESKPMGDLLASADWWEERGEPKLAALLRSSNRRETSGDPTSYRRNEGHNKRRQPLR